MIQTLPRALTAVLIFSAGLTTACGDSTSPSELVMGTWTLDEIRLADGRRLTPSDPSRFTIEFTADGQVLVQADCNSCGGRYTLSDDEDLTIDELACTLIACPAGSIDQEYLAILTEATAVEVEDDELELRSAEGTLIFRR